MDIRVSPDRDQPSASIQITIRKPLPDYDLLQIEQPTPREVDSVLVSQGFRDLVDDARGILTNLISNPPPMPNNTGLVDLGIEQMPHFEIAQLTGAICPGEDEAYRPGLWIILRDLEASPKQGLSEPILERLRLIAHDLCAQLSLN